MVAAKKKSNRVSEVVFYVEGDAVLRAPMRKFFASLAEKAKAHGVQEFTIKMAGSGSVAYKLFCNEYEKRTDALMFLLIDSEAAVAEFGKPWQHLAARADGSLRRLKRAKDDDCQLMVQAMEAWFLADPGSLKSVITNIQIDKLPGASTDVEAIPKKSHESIINDAIPSATSPTRQRKYSKKNDAPRILERIDVERVRARLPHCNRIFEVVGGVINKL